jgi:hypothetical protein
MAITISQSPQLYTFSGNPIVWGILSNQTVQPNFYYEVDVKVNGVTVETHELFPENGSYAKIDVHTIVDALMSYQDQTITPNTLVVGQTLTEVGIVVREYYSDTLQDTETTSIVYVLKGALDFGEFISYNSNTYAANNINRQFLTRLKSHINYNTYGVILNNPSGTYDHELAVSLDGGSYSFIPIADLRMAFLNINKVSLIAAGLNATAVNNATNIKFYIYDVGNSRVSEIMTIDLSGCVYFNNLVKYYNRYGIPEQFIFGQYEKRRFNSDASFYEKRMGAWNVSNQFVYTGINSGVVPIETSRTESIELFTSILPHNIANYVLTEVNSSPLTILNNTFVLIPTASYEHTNEHDDVKQVSIVSKIGTTYKSVRI